STFYDDLGNVLTAGDVTGDYSFDTGTELAPISNTTTVAVEDDRVIVSEDGSIEVTSLTSTHTKPSVEDDGETVTYTVHINAHGNDVPANTYVQVRIHNAADLDAAIDTFKYVVAAEGDQSFTLKTTEADHGKTYNVSVVSFVTVTGTVDSSGTLTTNSIASELITSGLDYSVAATGTSDSYTVEDDHIYVDLNAQTVIPVDSSGDGEDHLNGYVLVGEHHHTQSGGEDGQSNAGDVIYSIHVNAGGNATLTDVYAEVLTTFTGTGTPTTTTQYIPLVNPDKDGNVYFTISTTGHSSETLTVTIASLGTADNNSGTNYESLTDATIPSDFQLGNDQDIVIVDDSNVTDNTAGDHSAPEAPVFTNMLNDTGSSATDHITSDTSPTLTITAEPDAVVQVFNGTTFIGTANETATAGTFSFTPASNLSAGTYNYTAVATDAAGNVSILATPMVVTVDTSTTAGTLSLSSFIDTGASSADNITNDNSFGLSLTGNEGFSTVVYQVSINGGAVWSTVSDTGDTNHSDERYQYRATSTDLVGNTATSNTVTVLVDTIKPTADLTFGSNNALSPNEKGRAIITFSEKVDITTFTVDDLIVNATYANMISITNLKFASDGLTATVEVTNTQSSGNNIITTDLVTIATNGGYRDIAGNTSFLAGNSGSVFTSSTSFPAG
ncbi:MAG: Ig-like domain-containing protein, partial [Methylococcaceae bacterium]